MNVIPLTGLAGIAHKYRLIVCDLWGVVHNGRHAFPKALICLNSLSEAGAIIHLVSNAPRPSNTIKNQLRQLGIEDRYYHELVTSGDVTRAALMGEKTRDGKISTSADLTGYSNANCLHIGPQRDRPLFEGLNCRLITGLGQNQIADADFILCTGLYDDETETADEYSHWLELAVSRDLLMVCANPDLIVIRGNDKIQCAGAVAAAYESVGGSVQYFGKPHTDVYNFCLRLWHQNIGIISPDDTLDPAQVLVVGDSLHTDIPGAHAMSFHSVLIAAGIHAEEFGGETDQLPAPNVIRQTCERFGVAPDYVMASFSW